MVERLPSVKNFKKEIRKYVPHNILQFSISIFLKLKIKKLSEKLKKLKF